MIWIIIACIVIALLVLKIGFHLGYETAKKDALSDLDLYITLAKFGFGHDDILRKEINEFKVGDIYASTSRHESGDTRR